MPAFIVIFRFVKVASLDLFWNQGKYSATQQKQCYRKADPNKTAVFQERNLPVFSYEDSNIQGDQKGGDEGQGDGRNHCNPAD